MRTTNSYGGMSSGYGNSYGSSYGSSYGGYGGYGSMGSYGGYGGYGSYGMGKYAFMKVMVEWEWWEDPKIKKAFYLTPWSPYKVLAF